MAEISSIVAKIRHILKNHTTLSPGETDIVNAWLERFMKPPTSDFERSNVIQYAKFLEYQVKYKSLSHPFNQPPPQPTLEPLSDVINDQLNWNETDQAPSSQPEHCKAHYHNERPHCQWGPNTSWTQNVKEQDLDSTEQCTAMDDCREIMKIFNDAKTTLPLTDFLTQIIPFTGDNGELIREIASTELNAFRELVFRIFSDRIQQVDKSLSSKQCLLKYKFTVMEQQLLNRAKIAQNNLKQLLPGFNYNDYINDSNYIRNILLDVDKKQTTSEATCEPKFLSPEDSLKQQQFKLKYLRDEIRRQEEENEELMDEHNNLMLQLNQAIKQQQETCQENIKRNKSLKDKLTGLKITAEENQILLDKFMAENAKAKK